MRFKADENLPPAAVERLAAAGHDVASVKEQRLSGASDERLHQVVVREDRALITLDLDFADPLRFPTLGTAGLVVLRLPRPSRTLVIHAVETLLPLLEHERLQGRRWIVEPDRVRIHIPEDEELLP